MAPPRALYNSGKNNNGTGAGTPSSNQRQASASVLITGLTLRDLIKNRWWHAEGLARTTTENKRLEQKGTQRTFTDLRGDQQTHEKMANERRSRAVRRREESRERRFGPSIDLEHAGGSFTPFYTVIKSVPAPPSLEAVSGQSVEGAAAAAAASAFHPVLSTGLRTWRLFVQ